MTEEIKGKIKNSFNTTHNLGVYNRYLPKMKNVAFLRRLAESQTRLEGEEGTAPSQKMF